MEVMPRVGASCGAYRAHPTGRLPEEHRAEFLQQRDIAQAVPVCFALIRRLYVVLAQVPGPRADTSPEGCTDTEQVRLPYIS
jgi:hypothetical protein